jgi:phenylacetate-CoA ligase
MTRSPARTLLARAAWHLSPTGQNTTYKLLRESEWWPAEQLEALRLQALRDLLETASAIPFYRNRFRESGISPGDIRSLDDLTRIPPLERGEFQRQGIRGLAQQGASGTRRRTSGSVGQPLEVLRPPELRPWSAAVYRRFHESLGVRPGEHQLGLRTSGRRDGRGSRLRRIPPNLSVIQRSDLTDPEAFRRVLRLLARRPPALIGGFSTGLYYFATMLSAAGRTVRAKACWSGGNVLAEHHRPAIEEAFGCEVYQRYACEEVGVVAHDCPEGRSLHVAAETIIAEVVRDDGRPAEPGEVGQLLLTDLRNLAMPVIRYRIGDIASRPENPQCRCGRSLPVLGKLIGRSNDVLVKSDGTILLPGFVTDVMQNALESVLEYRVLQHPDLSIEVSMVQRDEPDPDQARRRIAAALDELVGIAGATRIERVGEIPLIGVDKLRHIESHVPAGGGSSVPPLHETS